ncbi:MAG: hypothetical protein DMF82_15390 [Acidobacteria bacterium]|nr:MAG: hypothetical protein DMF82_15390 [Acidobacteriota bacterium]
MRVREHSVIILPTSAGSGERRATRPAQTLGRPLTALAESRGRSRRHFLSHAAGLSGHLDRRQEMKLFILGANGKTGTQLVDLALARGHQFTAFVRSPGKITRRHPRLQVQRGDPHSADRRRSGRTRWSRNVPPAPSRR